jgi:hypothetical protein
MPKIHPIDNSGPKRNTINYVASVPKQVLDERKENAAPIANPKNNNNAIERGLPLLEKETKGGAKESEGQEKENTIASREKTRKVESEKEGLQDATAGDAMARKKEVAEAEEAKRLERERLEKEELKRQLEMQTEKERLEKERLEKERFEKERFEKERLEKERLQREYEAEEASRIQKEKDLAAELERKTNEDNGSAILEIDGSQIVNVADNAQATREVEEANRLQSIEKEREGQPKEENAGVKQNNDEIQAERQASSAALITAIGAFSSRQLLAHKRAQIEAAKRVSKERFAAIESSESEIAAVTSTASSTTGVPNYNNITNEARSEEAARVNTNSSSSTVGRPEEEEDIDRILHDVEALQLAVIRESEAKHAADVLSHRHETPEQLHARFEKSILRGRSVDADYALLEKEKEVILHYKIVCFSSMHLYYLIYSYFLLILFLFLFFFVTFSLHLLTCRASIASVVHVSSSRR